MPSPFAEPTTRDLAEDITASTFERAYRTLDRFEWRGGGFGAWLFRIAANELADHYRQGRARQSPTGARRPSGSCTVGFTEDDLDGVEFGDGEITAVLRRPRDTLNIGTRRRSHCATCRDSPRKKRRRRWAYPSR